MVIPRRVLCKAARQAKVARNAESLFQRLRASNIMKHVCAHGVWNVHLKRRACQMRSRRRRKALASLPGFSTPARPQALLGASQTQWIVLARTSIAPLRPSADAPERGGRRFHPTASAKTRVCGAAVPIDVGAEPRALDALLLGRSALCVSSFVSEALRR
jgi:hypothetical protein